MSRFTRLWSLVKLAPRVPTKRFRVRLFEAAIFCLIGSFVLVYQIFFAWWFDPLTDRYFERKLKDQVRHDLAFLFDEEGKEISGARPPEFVENFQQGRPPRPAPGLLRFAPDRFLRQTSITVNGRRFTLVMSLPPVQPSFWGPRSVPGLWILIAVISSGLVCYPLARYMTRPVVMLRAAAQKLAAGDLSARAGTSESRRKDEIAELVRDFDSMAGRLEAMVKAQSRLWSDVSHELRSPLARLSVALELARQRSGPGASSALERITLESERLNELIGRLLTIAKLESGEDGIEKSAVHLEELISEVAKDAAFEAQSRQCYVAVDISEDLVVMGSASLLRSAIENVIRNGIRYTKEGTHVQITLERDDLNNSAVLTVEDSGAFAMPWSASQTYRRTQDSMLENACAETAIHPIDTGLPPIPMANQPDF